MNKNAPDNFTWKNLKKLYFTWKVRYNENVICIGGHL